MLHLIHLIQSGSILEQEHLTLQILQPLMLVLNQQELVLVDGFSNILHLVQVKDFVYTFIKTQDQIDMLYLTV